MWLWGTTIDREVSAASQGSMYAKFEESEKKKAAKPKPSPWVTIGNVAAEVPMSSAGEFFLSLSYKVDSRDNFLFRGH